MPRILLMTDIAIARRAQYAKDNCKPVKPVKPVKAVKPVPVKPVKAVKPVPVPVPMPMDEHLDDETPVKSVKSIIITSQLKIAINGLFEIEKKKSVVEREMKRLQKKLDILIERNNKYDIRKINHRKKLSTVDNKIVDEYFTKTKF